VEKRRFGSTDMDVGILGFGAAEIGFSGASVGEVERLLDEAFSVGVNVIDTAPLYCGSEELIGKAAAGRRDEYYLFSKVGNPANPTGREVDYRRYLEESKVATPGDWFPDSIEKSINTSLKRLRTDHIDVIHLHCCSEEILRQDEVLNVLEHAKSAGKIRYTGYSGDGKDARFAVQSGYFDSLMTSINIADQVAIDTTVLNAAESGMGVVAKRPIANRAWFFRERPDDVYFGYYVEYWNRLRALSYDFLKSGGNASVGEALRFTLSVPGVHTAIVGTTNPDRFAENAALLSQGMMKEEEIRAIRDRWSEVAFLEWVGMI